MIISCVTFQYLPARNRRIFITFIWCIKFEYIRAAYGAHIARNLADALTAFVVLFSILMSHKRAFVRGFFFRFCFRINCFRKSQMIHRTPHTHTTRIEGYDFFVSRSFIYLAAGFSFGPLRCYSRLIRGLCFFFVLSGALKFVCAMTRRDENADVRHKP